MNTKLLVLIAAGVVLVTSGCSDPKDPDSLAATEHYRAEKRQEIFKDCLSRIPVGPQRTHYNDWDEVVQRCDSIAYYQSNGMVPQLEKPDTTVGDMCQQRDSLLEEGLEDKFDAYVCIRPQE